MRNKLTIYATIIIKWSKEEVRRSTGYPEGGRDQGDMMVEYLGQGGGWDSGKGRLYIDIHPLPFPWREVVLAYRQVPRTSVEKP